MKIARFCPSVTGAGRASTNNRVIKGLAEITFLPSLLNPIFGVLFLHLPTLRGFFITPHRADFIQGSVNGVVVVTILGLQFRFQKFRHLTLNLPLLVVQSLPRYPGVLEEVGLVPVCSGPRPLSPDSVPLR